MIFIGTSGYNYPHWWNGVFYPSDLPQKKWLEFYAEYFDTVELNVSFYRLPKKEVFEGWYKRTPKRFFFAVKGKPIHHPYQTLKGLQRTPFPSFRPCLTIEREIGSGALATPPTIQISEGEIGGILCSSLNPSSF